MIGAVEFEAGNEAVWLRKKGVPLFFFLVEGMICTDIHVLYILVYVVSLSLSPCKYILYKCLCKWVSGIV